MSPRLHLTSVLLAWSLCACPSKSSSQPHNCATNADCMTSCRYGAVNRHWHSENAGEECDDGCASRGAVSSCEAGACVSRRDGEVVVECTRVDVDRPR
jgi:hypothetical protein